MASQQTNGDDVPQGLQAGDPYCAKCGYLLKGLKTASACPECGTPLVVGLVRVGQGVMMGRRYTSSGMLWGLPLISVALGPTPSERFGRAKGWLAIGDTATGVVALGGKARGVFAVGGVCVGVFCIGGVGFGVLTAAGGAAVALGWAVGGAAIGGLATGGAAIGGIADGGAAIGYVARGGGVAGKYVWGPMTRDPVAVDVFKAIQPYTSWLGNNPVSPMITQLLLVGGLTLAMTLILVALWRRSEARVAQGDRLRIP